MPLGVKVDDSVNDGVGVAVADLLGLDDGVDAPLEVLVCVEEDVLTGVLVAAAVRVGAALGDRVPVGVLVLSAVPVELAVPVRVDEKDSDAVGTAAARLASYGGIETPRNCVSGAAMAMSARLSDALMMRYTRESVHA